MASMHGVVPGSSQQGCVISRAIGVFGADTIEQALNGLLVFEDLVAFPDVTTRVGNVDVISSMLPTLGKRDHVVKVDIVRLDVCPADMAYEVVTDQDFQVVNLPDFPTFATKLITLLDLTQLQGVRLLPVLTSWVLALRMSLHPSIALLCKAFGISLAPFFGLDD